MPGVKKQNREKWLSFEEAAIRLDVRPLTIKKWAEAGMLFLKKAKVITYVTRIAESSLANARTSKCLFCGKIFESKHPRKAMFCSSKHRYAYYYLSRTKVEKQRSRGKA